VGIIFLFTATFGCGGNDPVPAEVQILPTDSEEPASIAAGQINIVFARTPCGPLKVFQNARVLVWVPRKKASCTVKVEVGNAQFAGAEMSAGSEKTLAFQKQVPNTP
jgi:hypothetical protein